MNDTAAKANVNNTPEGRGATGISLTAKDAAPPAPFALPARHLLAALIGYSVLTGVVLWPLVVGFRTTVPVTDDSFFLLWNFWWFNEGTSLGGQSLLWTGYQYYPTGSPLFFHPFNLAQLIWTSPFYWLTGPISAFNASILISFILSGFVTYLLGLRLFRSRLAAFACGLVFMLAPFRFSHVQGGHISYASLQWVSLAFLMLLLWRLKPTHVRAAFAGLAFALVFYTDWYQLIALFGSAAIWLCFEIARSRNSGLGDGSGKGERRPFRLVITTAVTGALTFLFLTGPFLVPAIARSSEFERPSGDVLFSTDLLGFFVPGAFSIWGGPFRDVWARFTGGAAEHASYLGYSVIVLGLFACVKRRRDSSVWICILLFGVVLSLGPYLHIGGRYEFPVSRLGIFEPIGQAVRSAATRLNPSWCISPDHVALPLPYLALKKAPFLSAGRAPARFLVMVYLGSAVLAGLGLLWLQTSALRRRRLFSTLAIILIVVEFLPSGRQFGRPPPTPFLSALADENSEAVVLDLCSPGERLYHQTLHRTRMIGGYMGREHNPAARFLEGFGLRDCMRQLTPCNPVAVGGFVRDFPVTHVVLPTDQRELSNALLAEGFVLKNQDEAIALYERTTAH